VLQDQLQERERKQNVRERKNVVLVGPLPTQHALVASGVQSATASATAITASATATASEAKTVLVAGSGSTATGNARARACVCMCVCNRAINARMYGRV
jgi:hypothetical protein